MTEVQLKQRTKQFTHKCVKLEMLLPNNYLENHIKGQIIRCSTSVAANYRAVCIVQSKKSFIAKLGIVIEEVDECNYWLEFIVDEELLEKKKIDPLLKESAEITSIFIASRKTARKRIENSK